jgi:hypothetical protein
LRQAFNLNFELRSVQIGGLEGFILLKKYGLKVLQLRKQRCGDFCGQRNVIDAAGLLVSLFSRRDAHFGR